MQTSEDQNQHSSEANYETELTGIAKSAGYTAAGFVFVILVSFFTNVLITRTLGAEQYGLFVLATRVMDMLLPAAVFGFNVTIVRNLSFYQAQRDDSMVKGIVFFSIKTVFIIAVFCAFAGLMLSDFIANQIFERPDLGKYIRILMPAIPLFALTTVFISTLNGLKRIKLTVLISSIFSPAFMFLSAGVVAYFHLHLVGMIQMVVVAALGGFILSSFFLHRKYLSRTKQITSKVNKREMWSYATPLFFNQMLNNMLKIAPIFLLGIFLSNREIGLFNVGYKIALLVSFSLGAFHLIFAPVMSGFFAKNDKAMVGRLYKTITKWIFSLSLVVLFIIILYSKTLLGIFGAEFSSGVNILLILSAGEFINATVGQAGNLIIVSGRPRLALINSIAASILVITLSLFLIPPYGSTGAAIAVAVSVSLINIARVIELVFLEKMHPFKISFFKPLLAAVTSGLLIFWLNFNLDTNAYLELALGSVLFVAMFIIISLLLKLDVEDRFILDRIMKFIR
jgi:O-antigen/teichoic acid export membrane protein